MTNTFSKAFKKHVKISKDAIGKTPQSIVFARDLYLFLNETDQDRHRHFTRWLNDKIKKYSFQKDMDYAQIPIESTGGRPKREYVVTLEIARFLCLLEETLIGHQTRMELMRCESVAHEKTKTSRGYIRREFNAAKSLCQQLGHTVGGAMAEARKSIKTQEGVDVFELFPEVKNQYEYSHNCFTVTQLSKLLGLPTKNVNLLLKHNGAVKKPIKTIIPGPFAEHYLTWNNAHDKFKYNKNCLAMLYYMKDRPQWDKKTHRPTPAQQKELETKFPNIFG